MTTLSMLYSAKDKNGTDTKTRKIFRVPLAELYVEPGYNVRDIDQAHVEEFRDAFIAGEYTPPLAVQVTEKGVKIIDGHHRYYGAIMATEAGHEVLRLECNDFIGSEADRIAFMVTSSQGKALEPLERAGAYQRLKNQGWEVPEIARKVKRSVADVEHHLQLLGCGDAIIGMVKAKELSATTAVSLAREHGAKAGAVAEQKLAEAKASGKSRLTKSAAIPQFNAGKARRLVELMAAFEFTDDGYTAPDDVYLEAMGIIAEYREKHGQPAAKQPKQTESDEALPLTKDAIIDQAGVAVWACAAAAFGEKDEYTFSESKYAHTWADDSLEKPEVVVVPAETIQKALALIEQHDSSSELREWVDKAYTDETQRDEMFDRFLTVYRENRAAIKSVPDYLSLLQCTLSASWSNIRTLRAAVRQAIAEAHGVYQ